MQPSLELEEALKKELDIKSVSGILELFDLKSYENIKELHRKKEIVFGFLLQENIVENFGSKGQVVMDKTLSFSPIFMIILAIVFAIVKSNYLLLIGIPLSMIGMFLTTSSIMKQGSSLFGIIMLGTLISGIYYCFKDFNIAFLLLSYGIPNFFLTVKRQLNSDIFEEAVLSSEIIFVYYFLRGECYIKKQNNGRLYHIK